MFCCCFVLLCFAYLDVSSSASVNLLFLFESDFLCSDGIALQWWRLLLIFLCCSTHEFRSPISLSQVEWGRIWGLSYFVLPNCPCGLMKFSIEVFSFLEKECFRVRSGVLWVSYLQQIGCYLRMDDNVLGWYRRGFHVLESGSTKDSKISSFAVRHFRV